MWSWLKLGLKFSLKDIPRKELHEKGSRKVTNKWCSESDRRALFCDSWMMRLMQAPLQVTEQWACYYYASMFMRLWHSMGYCSPCQVELVCTVQSVSPAIAYFCLVEEAIFFSAIDSNKSRFVPSSQLYSWILCLQDYVLLALYHVTFNLNFHLLQALLEVDGFICDKLHWSLCVRQDIFLKHLGAHFLWVSGRGQWLWAQTEVKPSGFRSLPST